MKETLQQVLAELPEIRERADKATQGPWDIIPDDTLSRYIGNEEDGDFIKCMYLNREGNAKFIAHAREDVPKLCDALQAAADEITQIEQDWKADVLTFGGESMARLKVENQRLQAEIEQKNAALSIYSDDSNWSSDWGWKGINDPTLIAKRELGGNQG